MPETIVAMAALVVLFIDLGIMRPAEGKFRRMIAALVTGTSCLVAIFWMHQVQQETAPGFLSGLLVVDSLTQFVKQAVLVLTLFTAWVSIDSAFTDHTGEYFALLLLATVGMMFLASAENLLMIFIALELLSLSLYILTAFNKRNIKSAEAALKYFLFGGMAAAFTLFGLSLLYGIAGSTNLGEIAKGAAENAMHAVGGTSRKAIDPLLIVAIVQTSVRRLLAYSAIAHAGYMLLAVLSGRQALASLIYYALTYGLTTLGAFGVVGIVQNQAGSDRLEDFAGLCRRAPIISFC